MCDVNTDIFIEQQVRKPMEVPVTKPQDPLEVNEIIQGPLILGKKFWGGVSYGDITQLNDHIDEESM